MWAILYNNTLPSNTVTFAGLSVTADLTAPSANLCWDNSASIGYAADVTRLVSDNGDYEITDIENCIINDSPDPFGVLLTLTEHLYSSSTVVPG